MLMRCSFQRDRDRTGVRQIPVVIDGIHRKQTCFGRQSEIDRQSKLLLGGRIKVDLIEL